MPTPRLWPTIAPLAPSDPAVLVYLRGADDADGAAAPLLTLNSQQRATVEHSPGPVMIIAGPGTGRIRVLTQRLAHLVRSGVVPISSPA